MSTGNNDIYSQDALDSDDLMSWLLLNPEVVDEFDDTVLNSAPEGGAGTGNGSLAMHGFYYTRPPTTTHEQMAGHFPQNFSQTNQHSLSLAQGMVQHDHLQYSNPAVYWGQPAQTHAYGAAGGAANLSCDEARVAPLQIANDIPTVSMKRKEPTSSDEKRHRKDSAGTVGGNSRKRHREMSYDEALQKYNQLKKENTELQAHYNDVTHRTTEVQKQRNAMERLMTSKFVEMGDKDDKEKEEELAGILKQYTDIYADYGKCRQREVAFHLNQLEKLIVPTRTTKMLLWTLQQEKSFFLSSKSPLYQQLSQAMEISPEQSEKIQERREAVLELLAQLKESLSLLDQLKVAIEKKHSCYDGVCGRVQEAGSPKQTVRFLLWLAKNYKVLAKHIPPNYPCRSTSVKAAAEASSSVDSPTRPIDTEAGVTAVSLTSSRSYMAQAAVQELLPDAAENLATTPTAGDSSSSLPVAVAVTESVSPAVQAHTEAENAK